MAARRSALVESLYLRWTPAARRRTLQRREPEPPAWLAWVIAIALGAFETLVIAGWQPRYRLPMDMALTVAASVFYAVLWERMRSRTPQKL